MQVVKIKGVGFLGKDLQSQMMTQMQIEIQEIQLRLEFYGHKEILKTPVYLSIDTMFMVFEPQTILNGVVFEFLVNDRWMRIFKKEIVKIEEDSEELILMVTTLKRGKKNIIVFMLGDKLKLDDEDDKGFQPTKFKFNDFLKSKDIIFDDGQCSQSYRNLGSETRTFNNILYHYVDEMLYGMNKVSLEDFKNMLSEPNEGVGLCSVCVRDILKKEEVKHKCKKCAKVCRMKCSLCKVVMYCDQTCQLADWENHKSMCNWFARARADRKRIASKFEEFILKRTKVSPRVTFEKFYSLLRKKIFLESRAIMYFPEQIPEVDWEHEVD